MGTNLKEEWRAIPISRLFGRYEVSNLGRVRKLGCYTKSGKKVNDKIMSLHNDNYGYTYLRVIDNYKKYDYKTHRLVALAFIPNPNNKPHVNHIDGVRDNNTVTNLEWCTPGENVANAVGRGMMNGAPRWWVDGVHSVPVTQKLNGRIIAKYKSVAEAEKKTGIANQNIFRALKNPAHSAGGFKWARV